MVVMSSDEAQVTLFELPPRVVDPALIDPARFSGEHVLSLVGAPRPRTAGAPLFGVLLEMDHYFDPHHSAAETLDKVGPDHLQKPNCLATAESSTARIIRPVPDVLDCIPHA